MTETTACAHGSVSPVVRWDVDFERWTVDGGADLDHTYDPDSGEESCPETTWSVEAIYLAGAKGLQTRTLASASDVALAFAGAAANMNGARIRPEVASAIASTLASRSLNAVRMWAEIGDDEIRFGDADHASFTFQIRRTAA